MAAASLIVAAIEAQYGKYRDSGQSIKDIFKRQVSGFTSASYGTVRKRKEGFYETSRLDVNRVLQAFQSDFTPKGGFEFTPKKIEAQHVKVDLEYDPSVIYNDWLDFLRDGNIDPLKMPLFKYIQNLVIERCQADMESEWFNGAPVAVVKGTATGDDKSYLGIGTQMKQMWKDPASKMRKIDLGSVDSINYFDKVEEFIDEIDELDLPSMKNVFVKAKNKRIYKRSERNQNFVNGGTPDDKVFDTEVNVTALPSMSGSSIIWTTPKENLITIFKDDANAAAFQVVTDIRKVKISTDFYVGVGTILDDLVFSFIPENERLAE